MPTSILRRLRPILAGIVVVVLTAGAAFAGQPTETPVDGLAIAAERSGLSLPPGSGNPVPDDDPAVDEEGDEGDELAEAQEEVEGDGEHCVDPTTLSVEELADANHGSIVCWAAHQETPDGYDNHGQWVSEWAKANNGGEVQALRSAKAKGKARAR